MDTQHQVVTRETIKESYSHSLEIQDSSFFIIQVLLSRHPRFFSNVSFRSTPARTVQVFTKISWHLCFYISLMGNSLASLDTTTTIHCHPSITISHASWRYNRPSLKTLILNCKSVHHTPHNGKKQLISSQCSEPYSRIHAPSLDQRTSEYPESAPWIINEYSSQSLSISTEHWHPWSLGSSPSLTIQFHYPITGSQWQSQQDKASLGKPFFTARTSVMFFSIARNGLLALDRWKVFTGSRFTHGSKDQWIPSVKFLGRWRLLTSIVGNKRFYILHFRRMLVLRSRDNVIFLLWLFDEIEIEMVHVFRNPFRIAGMFVILFSGKNLACQYM